MVDESALVDVPPVDPAQESILDEASQAELRQAEIDAAFAADDDTTDESIYE